MSQVVVMGAGAWGTALAIQAARAGADVMLCPRDPARATAMAASRENPRLPGLRLPDGIHITATLPHTADLTLLAMPLQHLRAASACVPDSPLLVCAKGVEAGSHRLPLEIVAALHPRASTGMLTGPNFAREIALGLPAAAVIAAADPGLRAGAAALLGSPGFRLYGNDDPIGAQLGGAAKNVIAIAAGAVIGAELGENARAGLITRGLAELARLAVALGGRAETVMGLSGLGDLLLSCTSETSRNYSLGLALGRGEMLGAVRARSTWVMEGIATAPALVARAGGVEMPICRAVAALLGGGITLEGLMQELLARPRRDE